MISADADYLKLRHLAVLLVFAKFFDPLIDPHIVGNGQIPCREGSAEMAFERWLMGEILAPRFFARIIAHVTAAAGFALADADKFSITAIADPGTLAIVPDIASGRA